ncbi:hypothetical protein BGZ74_004424 [Mortierella antarctica]|nr:hypothetical protein BGZ74_004424 [Mortierella antarctica]
MPTFKHHRPRSFTKSLVATLVFALLLSLCLVSAQSSGGSPPLAQPGSDLSDPPTKTHGGDSGGGHGSVTVPGGATVTAVPSPSVVTTVSVINGTTTTITMTITAAGPAPVVPTTSTIPKAAQSILVVQSTTYGKVLPAAGPVDDRIESHFWDQFSPPDMPGKGKSSSASHRAQSAVGWLLSVFGQSLVMVVCVTSLVAPAWIL